MKSLGKYIFLLFLAGVYFYSVGASTEVVRHESEDQEPKVETVRETEEHGHEENGEDKDYFEEVSVDQKRMDKAGYVLEVDSVRYEYDPEYLQVMFKADLVLINESFEPYATTGGNCDLYHDGKLIREGAGVQLSEITNVYPGESLKWQIMIPYQAGRRVGACKYSPTNSYNQDITVEFEIEE